MSKSRSRRLAVGLILTAALSMACVVPAEAATQAGAEPTSLVGWIVEVVGEWLTGSGNGTIDPNG